MRHLPAPFYDSGFPDVRLAEGLGLAFAGIDLKITPDNRVYCFEVNPSPAFSYYEANTGQPIARAVAEYLAAG